MGRRCQDRKILELNFPNKRYEKVLSYKNGKQAGAIFIDDGILDISFLKSILNNHFNFEMAKEPSQNLRVQISVNLDNINNIIRYL